MSKEARKEESDRLKNQIMTGYFVSCFNAAIAEHFEGRARDANKAPPMETALGGRNAKKNRKERERKSRRKREGKSDFTLQGTEPHSESDATLSHHTEPQPAESDATLSHRTEPQPAEPQNVETQPEENFPLSYNSPPPTTAHQTPTTTTNISRLSRPVVIPAVPFNLHFHKKPSKNMERDIPEVNLPATDQKSQGQESQICSSPVRDMSPAVSTKTEDTGETSNNMERDIPNVHLPATNQKSDGQEAQICSSPVRDMSPAVSTRTEDTDEVGMADSGKKTNTSSPKSLQEKGIDTSTSLSPKHSSSPVQTARTAAEKPEVAEEVRETAEISSAPSTEDSSKDPTASPTAKSSGSEQVTAAVASLSVQSSGHAEETSASQTHRSVSAPTAGPSQAPAQPPARLIEFDTYAWPCRNQECRKLTSPYDGSTVICPRCGPYSSIRYCSKKCLFADALMHWGVECGKYTLTEKADPLTIHSRQVSIQPAIPSLTRHDRPERHRQMVRHSLDRTGDYFVFSDWVDWRADGFPADWPAIKHASGELLATVNFTENGSSVPARHFFVRLIRICFLVGAIRTDMTYFLFRMIRGRLTELGLASDDVKNCLVWQFKHEFAWGGGFELLADEQPVNWPLVAGQIVQLEAQYRSFLFGGAGLGAEWSNKV